MNASGVEVSKSGVIFIDKINSGSLTYDNNQYIINDATKIAIYAVKVSFRPETLIGHHIHFNIKCNAIETYNFDKKIRGVVVVPQIYGFKEIFFNPLYFKNILHTHPTITFESDNPNIFIEHIILIYKKYD